MSAKELLALALDTPRLDVAEDLVRRTRDEVGVYKIGLEMFMTYGPKAVERLKNLEVKIFLDLKLHETPSTVAGAVKAASALGIDFLSVHALGGSAMLKAAVSARDEAHLGREKMKILAVPLLPHYAANALKELGLVADLEAEVLRLAKLAAGAKVDGFLCAAADSVRIREALGDAFFMATSGIHLEGGARGDQSRTRTPAEIVSARSNLWVVGRAIRIAPDPKEAAIEILAAILAVQKELKDKGTDVIAADAGESESESESASVAEG